MAVVAKEPMLAVDALDALDLGVVVSTPALDQVLFANEAARRLLRELGADRIHPVLRAAIESSRQLTSAVRLVLASGRVFIRTRQLQNALLVTIAREVLREDDLFELLRRRFTLSIRDRQVIALVRAGHSNQDIGRELGISVGTVKQYLNRVFKTFDVHSRGELVALIERIAREQLVA
jgi:DNA-binding CsgD family transcriptional regulator